MKIETGVDKIQDLFRIVKNDCREETSISNLVIGVKCGGSDGIWELLQIHLSEE